MTMEIRKNSEETSSESESEGGKGRAGGGGGGGVEAGGGRRVKIREPEEEAGAQGEGEFEEKFHLMPSLDGGWGWMCVLACAFMHFLLGGYGRSFGVVYVEMLQQFDCSATTGSTIGGVFVALRMGFGPLVSALTNRFSKRAVTSAGALLFAMGAFLSGLATSSTQMLLSFSLLGGLGAALVYFPSVVIVGEYFSQRRGIAMGLATAGSGMGCIIIPPLYHIMFEKYGMQGTFLIVSGALLNLFVCAALYRPLAHSKARRLKLHLPCQKYSPEYPIACKDSILTPLINWNVTAFSQAQHSKEVIERKRNVLTSVKSKTKSRQITVLSLNSVQNNDISNELQKISLPEKMETSELSVEADALAADINESCKIAKLTFCKIAPSIAGEDEDEKQSLLNGYNFESSTPSFSPASSEISTSSSNFFFSSCSSSPLLFLNEADRCYHRLTTILRSVNFYFNIHLLLDPSITAYVLALSLCTMAFISSQNLIVAHVIELGFESTWAIYILSTVGIADTVGRVLSGLFYDFMLVRRVRCYVYSFILLGSGLSTLGWSFCTDYLQVTVLSFANGALYGAVVAGRPVIVGDFVAAEYLSGAFALTVFGQGVCVFIGPMISGYLKDVTGRYLMSFIFNGSCSCFGAILLFFTISVKRYRMTDSHSSVARL